MSIQIMDLKAQYNSIKDEIDTAIQRVLDHGQFILGPEVKSFEEEVSAYCGTGHAVGVASGTDALHLALLACGIKPGDEVITTPFTFIATAESIAKCGAIPVFADVEEKTCNIDPGQVEARITPGTKAIMPVHLYGQPASMQEILEIGRKNNVKVIEDCAQAMGAEYQGRKAGSLGDAGCLSFFPAKNLGAYGDGGMVITNDPDLADRVDILRRHGSRVSYRHLVPGFNSRLDALQASVLKVKLKYLDEWNECRRGNALTYGELLADVDGIELIHADLSGQTLSSCNYFTVRITSPGIDRSELRQYMKSSGIETAVYYPLSVHLQEVYSSMGYAPGDFPESERAQEEVLSLPMYPELREDQIGKIVDVLNNFISGDSI